MYANICTLFIVFFPIRLHTHTHTLPCKMAQAKQCEQGNAKEWAAAWKKVIVWYIRVLRLTWALSLSGCSSSSSASDAPRWPENTERSLALNRSDGGLQPARAADPAANHTPPSHHSPGWRGAGWQVHQQEAPYFMLLPLWWSREWL